MAIINNTASVFYVYGESGSNTAVSNVATTNLLENYSLQISKLTLNSSFRPGENLTFILSVTNTGTLPLFGVTITDDLGGSSAPLSFVEGSASQNIDGTILQIIPTSTNPLVFTLSSPLEAGETVTITYIAQVVSALDDSVDSITNTASALAHEGSDTGEIITTDFPASVTVEKDNYALITVTKSVSDNEISEGEQFGYSLILENSGNMPANGVTITDTLPSGFVISSITSESNGSIITFDESAYSVDPSTNTLTLPTAESGVIITVPASSEQGDGVVTITINGSINL